MTTPANVLPDIRALLPHSGPMVLLDRMLSADDDTFCAAVTIRADSVFCDGAAVGAWVGIEYMAQAIAAHAGFLARQRGAPIKVGFLLGARRYETHCAAFAVGTTLHVHVRRALQGDNGLGAFECHIDDAVDAANATAPALATATVTVYQPDNVNQFLKNGSSV
jgi:3-oxoacyl-[acyl-carrier-protein] synthase-1